MNKAAISGLLLLSLAHGARADVLSLDKLLAQAHEKNPDVLTARQAWEVKRAEVGAVGAWENPTFSYIDERFPTGTAGASPQKIRHYRLEQAIPFPGKLTGEARMKYHESLIAQARYQAQLIQTDKDVRMRFYQLYLVDEQISLADQSVEILKNALRSAQSRLASSQSSALDVFMAQTELAKAENAAFQMQQQRKLVQYELNTLLNQNLETPLGQAAAPELADLPLSVDDFQMLARHYDPLYLSSLHEVDHARAMLEHHRLDYAPDFGVMAEKEVSPGGADGRMLGISISLPLWFERPWKQVAAAQAHLSEAQAQSQAMQNLILKNVAAEVVETNSRLTVARNYLAQILPSAASALKIAQHHYASGQDDFMHLLEAYRSWLASHNEFLEQLYDYGEHGSALSQWLGVDIGSAKQTLEQLHATPLSEDPHE